MAQTLLQSRLQQVSQQRGQENAAQLQRQNQDAAAKQAQSYRMLDAGLSDQSGSIFDKLKKAGITSLGGQDISGLAPNLDDAVGGVSKQIQQHPDQWDPLSIINAVKAAPGGVIDPSSREPIQNLITQRNQALELKKNTAPMVGRKFINDQGVPSEEFVNPNNASPVQTELTGEQTGKRDLATWMGNQGDPTRQASEITQAGKMSGAQAGAAAAAQYPYSNPDILSDDKGNAHAMRYGPKGAEEIKLPPGLHPRQSTAGGIQKLTATQVEQAAGLNTAEVEGVRVLSALKQSGLDQSNNPADPRWEKFVVTTLKMAPRDFQKADMQQRTAFVNAALTRSLMGARPSQYVAQIIQQHLPQGEMTGIQLAHVLNNVLQQTDERRTEIESLTGREKGTLKPSSGMTYEQFLSGQVPNQDLGQPTIPSVQDIMSRPVRPR